MLMTMAILPITADDEVPALCISQTNGENQVELSEILSIKYTGTDMVINLKDGTRQTVPLDDIIVMELGKMVVSVRDLVKQSNGCDTYTITDINGKLIAKGKIKSNKLVNMPTRRGLYILTIGNQSQKILIK